MCMKQHMFGKRFQLDEGAKCKRVNQSWSIPICISFNIIQFIFLLSTCNRLLSFHVIIVPHSLWEYNISAKFFIELKQQLSRVLKWFNATLQVGPTKTCMGNQTEERDIAQMLWQRKRAMLGCATIYSVVYSLILDLFTIVHWTNSKAG